MGKLSLQSREDHFIDDDDRHRILEAIEEQAKSLSMARGSSQHRLSDWLSAAEEVMPEVKKPTVKPMSMNQAEAKSSASVISKLLIGSLILSLAGAASFGLYVLSQEFMKLTDENTKLAKHVQTLDAKLTALAETVEKSKNVASEEPSGLKGDETVVANSVTSTPSNAGSGAVEQVLDQRFKQLIELLDQKMRAPMPVAPPPVMASPAVIAPMATSTANSVPLSAPQMPNVSEPKPPAMPETLVVNEAVSNKGDVSSSSAQWLMEAPADGFVLQLGSNVKMEGLQALAKKIRQQPELAHLLPINANGSTRYVLTYGALTSRDEARQASDRLKTELGVSPWIRKVSDVQKLVAKP